MRVFILLWAICIFSFGCKKEDAVSMSKCSYIMPLKEGYQWTYSVNLIKTKKFDYDSVVTRDSLTYTQTWMVTGQEFINNIRYYHIRISSSNSSDVTTIKLSNDTNAVRPLSSYITYKGTTWFDFDVPYRQENNHTLNFSHVPDSMVWIGGRSVGCYFSDYNYAILGHNGADYYTARFYFADGLGLLQFAHSYQHDGPIWVPSAERGFYKSDYEYKLVAFKLY